MTSRERVAAAIHYQKPDKVPVEYLCTPVGYYEHGEKLNTLYATMPGDFAPFEHKSIPVLGPELFDKEGKYHEFRRDDWGVLWEYRIYGVAGIPYERPLEDLAKVYDYKFPEPPKAAGEQFNKDLAAGKAHREQYYHQVHAGSLFERMLELCGDENVYCEIAEDTKEVNFLADKLTEYTRERVEYAVALGADGVSFGDDYGTERALITSPEMWRSFFKPRLKYIFEPAVKVGMTVHFHSCGQIGPIIEDLAEVGATSIWPQLPAYDMADLAALCRSTGLAIAIHTDRANTMTFGTPQQVCDLVKREYETFKMADGGSWFYIEADNGFPFENLEALVNTVKEIR